MKLKLPQLNLPELAPKLQEMDGQVRIWDAIRKKHLVLTPEEWVRQHVIQWLVKKQYPKGRIVQEYGFEFNEMSFRADVVVFDQHNRPLLIVECKAPEVQLREEQFDQINKYNRVINSPLLVLTNGINHIISYLNDGNVQFLKDLPSYDELQTP